MRLPPPNGAPLLHDLGRFALSAAAWQRVPNSPVATVAGGPAAASGLQTLGSAAAEGAATLVNIAALPIASRSAAFWQLALAFVCGGLFVSSAFAVLGIAYTFGSKNVARLKANVDFVVRRTWAITVTMLGAASVALMRRRIKGAPCVATEDSDGCEVEMSRWSEAWAILRKGYREARSTAREGVEAIKLELSQYSAAVGVPGLRTLQYVVDRLTPLRFEACLQEALEEILSDMQVGSRKFVLQRFTAGKRPPQLLAARAYDLGPDALAFDVDTEWTSDMVATIEAVPEVPGRGAKVPVSVRNLRFKGPVRVVVTHLTAASPGYGALLLSLPAPPEISLDVRVAGGEVTKVPWLRAEVERALQASIADELTWPRRIVVPAEAPGEPIGTPVLPWRVLRDLEHTDPLLRAERALSSEQPGLGALQEEMRAEQSQRSSSDFSINLGRMVLTDLLTDFDFDKAVGNLTAAGLEQLATQLGVGNLTDARSTAATLEQILTTAGREQLINLEANLGDLVPSELTELTGNLTELYDTFGSLPDSPAAALGNLTELVSGELQARRERYEPKDNRSWWQGIGSALFGGGSSSDGNGTRKGALANSSSASSSNGGAASSAPNGTEDSDPWWATVARVAGGLFGGSEKANESSAVASSGGDAMGGNSTVVASLKPSKRMKSMVNGFASNRNSKSNSESNSSLGGTGTDGTDGTDGSDAYTTSAEANQVPFFGGTLPFGMFGGESDGTRAGGDGNQTSAAARWDDRLRGQAPSRGAASRGAAGRGDASRAGGAVAARRNGEKRNGGGAVAARRNGEKRNGEPIRGAGPAGLRAPPPSKTPEVAASASSAAAAASGGVATMSYRELQQACKARGLRAIGSADALRERLMTAQMTAEGAAAPPTESSLPVGGQPMMRGQPNGAAMERWGRAPRATDDALDVDIVLTPVAYDVLDDVAPSPPEGGGGREADGRDPAAASQPKRKTSTRSTEPIWD